MGIEGFPLTNGIKRNEKQLSCSPGDLPPLSPGVRCWLYGGGSHKVYNSERLEFSTRPWEGPLLCGLLMLRLHLPEALRLPLLSHFQPGSLSQGKISLGSRLRSKRNNVWKVRLPRTLCVWLLVAVFRCGLQSALPAIFQYVAQSQNHSSGWRMRRMHGLERVSWRSTEISSGKALLSRVRVSRGWWWEGSLAPER